MAAPAPVVSFEDEPLVLVDASDSVTGVASKAEAHDGDGLLHRAFSVFLFDGRGRTLLQRRSAQKRLWPLFWSNSCCSHPHPQEEVEAAALRRLKQELAVEARLAYLFKFTYHARYRDQGSERELCWVFAARSEDEVAVNPNEVAEWAWLEPEALDAALRSDPEVYSPWLRLEWPRLRAEHWDAVRALGSGAP